MTFEAQLTRAFETLTDRLRGDIDLQVQRTSGELAAAASRERDRAESGEQSAKEKMTVHEASRARLVHAVRSLECARSLSEILDTLVRCARIEATRADLWLLRGGRQLQWRSPGSAEAGGDSVIARSLDEGGVVADAVGTGAVASAAGTIAVPIVIAGQVVAVLTVEGLGTEDLELRTENLALRTADVEILTRYAARCLEALTAFTAARALTRRSDGPEAADGAPPAIDAASAEEDTAARRYARLLVSEIKLYHESAVVDGCRDRDLATRLGGEIARARAMFEQRVAPRVRLRADYFHGELVRTLANGDASLLDVGT